MPASNMAAEKRSQPQILVETAGLSEEEWLAYRRKGIGGSDVAALLGISPWRTARDLYFDKLNIVAVEDNEDNWVALEMGHLLEPLVAKIFQHRTGYKIYQIKKMFQHPQYSWMLADVDYFVELPDGSTAILEIKTTNYNARDNWWLNGEETVPVYYEAQGRHYLRKMAIDGYVVKLDLPELRELVSLLRYSSNNLNQLTRRAHETGRIYETDLEDIQQSQERIWTAVEKIVSSLAALK